MNAEDLVKVIRSAKLNILNFDEFGKLNGDLDLNRTLEFRINDEEFSILWFKNMMTLKTSQGLEVMFNEIVHSSTWPNNHKRNLQFYNNDGCVAVIGLELYKKVKQ